MRASGIVRKTDSLGRVTLPKELRRKLGINEHDGLEIYVEEDLIILAPEKKAVCVFCGGGKNLTHRLDKDVCGSCLSVLHSTGHEGTVVNITTQV